MIDPLSADLLRKSIHGNRGSKIYAGIKFKALYEPESKSVIEIPTKERYLLSGKPSEIFKPENINVISDPLEHTEPYAVISLTPAIIEGNKIKLDANLKINEFVSPYSELAINGEVIQKGRTLKEKEKNTKTTNVLKVFEKSVNTIIP